MIFFGKKIKRAQNPKGMILFLILLILGVTATGVVLMMSQSSVNGFISIDDQIKSQQVRLQLFGCLDEVLAKFAANSVYNPTVVDLATYTCTASVVTNVNQRTITLTRTDQGIVRRLVTVINVGAAPITVLSTLEQ